MFQHALSYQIPHASVRGVMKNKILGWLLLWSAIIALAVIDFLAGPE